MDVGDLQFSFFFFWFWRHIYGECKKVECCSLRFVFHKRRNIFFVDVCLLSLIAADNFELIARLNFFYNF